MDDALAWFRGFLDIEWAAKTAYHLEPDAETFYAARSAYRDLKEDDVGDYLNRSDSPESLALLRDAYASEGKRVLFAARPVRAGGEPAWAFYTSDFMVMPTGRAMDVMFVVQRVDGAFHVQAEYETCFECDGTGADDGDPCGECGGVGFTYSDGEDLGALEPAGDAVKLEAPTHAMSKDAYDAL